MFKSIRKIVLVMAMASACSSTFAKDIVLSEKSVKVPLPVGKEIIIKFPYVVTHTEVLNQEKPGGIKQFLRPDGVLMLEASEAFGKARMVAQMIDGNVVVLDLNAEVGAINYETIRLLDPKSIKKKPKPKPQKVKPIVPPKPEVNPYKPDFLKDGAAMTKTVATPPPIGFNDMVTFGFRHYVGPSRLIGNLPATPVKVSGIGNHWVRVWGDRLSIKPLQQWRIADNYLTVLLVNNLSSSPVEFDPRALRGRIRFAAALYPVIQPQGNVQDQTLWAIVTAVPFNQAIRRMP